MVCHGSNGHWASVDVEVGESFESSGIREVLSPTGTPKLREALRTIIPAKMPVSLFAGVASPYLLRVVNRRDPSRRPPVGYSHVILLWQAELEFDEAFANEPAPLTIQQAEWASTGVVLGPAHALAWFEDLFRELTVAMSALMSDRAIRDRLVQSGETDFLNLRYAALLTRHLGLQSELPEILDRAQLASAIFESTQAAGESPERNDRDSNMIMWTHERFMRFLDSATP
jgi:hypothetical protein